MELDKKPDEHHKHNQTNSEENINISNNTNPIITSTNFTHQNNAQREISLHILNSPIDYQGACSSHMGGYKGVASNQRIEVSPSNNQHTMIDRDKDNPALHVPPTAGGRNP